MSHSNKIVLTKICGITNASDANECLAAGADWIGLNLVGGPRRLTLHQLSEIVRAIPGASRAVVLINCRDIAADEAVQHGLGQLGIRRLQLYGAASAHQLRRVTDLGFEVIYVHHVVAGESLSPVADLLPVTVNYVLLDSKVPGLQGGTGVTADWDLIAEFLAEGRLGHAPVILAGGLTPENVGDAVLRVRPHGVDVSSGVESSPGRKDMAKVRRFLEAVRS